ncbi:MAG TPA: XRE family transcriptional regulator, partial [Sneathiellales bacterium]|nr:XRE family transcriptional regulator [Sneathiellales bacterium]
MAKRVDEHVGERIRHLRTTLGLTQEQLSSALGISYQQIQKYETGANRVSAGRLYEIAMELDVEPS